jgi:D-sedoheptulose 7-phosphate isomerase
LVRAALVSGSQTAKQYHGKRDFDELLSDRRGLLDAPQYREAVEAIVEAVVAALRAGNKVLWCGNGGSAAEAQHMAAELSGRFLRERPGLYSEALSVNSSTLTCVGNDYGYDYVFSRQVEAFARPGDVVIGMTTSGSSRNVVLALEAAKRRGAVTVAFTGNGGGKVLEFADHALIGPDGYAAIVQEVHQVMAHIVCDLVEQRLIFEGDLT